MRIGTVGASANGTFTLEYIPEYVGIKFSALATLDSVTITTDEGTICNLNGTAVRAIAQSLSQGDLSDTDNVYFIPVAEGYVSAKKCTIFVSAGAGGSGVEVYATSTKMADDGIIFNTFLFDVIANANSSIERFSKFGIIGFANSDVLTLNSVSGSSDRLFQEEIVSLASLDYDNQDDYVIFNNEEGNIKSIVYSPSANRTCWMVQAQFEGSKKMSEIVEKIAVKRLKGEGLSKKWKSQDARKSEQIAGNVVEKLVRS